MKNLAIMAGLIRFDDA